MRTETLALSVSPAVVASNVRGLAVAPVAGSAAVGPYLVGLRYEGDGFDTPLVLQAGAWCAFARVVERATLSTFGAAGDVYVSTASRPGEIMTPPAPPPRESSWLVYRGSGGVAVNLDTPAFDTAGMTGVWWKVQNLAAYNRDVRALSYDEDDVAIDDRLVRSLAASATETYAWGLAVTAGATMHLSIPLPPRLRLRVGAHSTTGAVLTVYARGVRP